jgi:phage terminase large subunit
MRKRLSLAAIEAIEEQVNAATGERHSTVFGIVGMDGNLLRCIEYVDGKWQEVDKQPKTYLAEKMERVLISDKRFVIIIGGRGSGKSVQAVDIAIHRIADFGHKVYGLREYQESIEDSVHSLFDAEVKRLGYEGFTVQKNTVFHKSGGMTKYRGLSVNPESIKSASAFNLFLAEEAAKLSDASLTHLTPTARNAAKPGLPGKQEESEGEDELKDVQMFFIANPQSKADPFSQKFLVPFWNDILRDGFYEDDLHLIVRVNYTDNPWFMQSGLDGERLNDKKILSTAKYNHIWEGDFLDDVENSIISVDMFNACIDAHIKLGFEPTGAIVVSHDPSDEGNDPKGLVVRRGSVILKAMTLRGVDAFMGMKMACDIAREEKADHFVWDGDGMGAILRDHATKYLAGLKIQTNMFRGSNSVESPEAIYNWENKGSGTRNNKTNKETFFNKKSQFNIKLRDRCYNTWRAVTFGEYCNPDEMISFSSSIEEIDLLRSETCRIPLVSNNNGKIQVMSKKDMKEKLKLPSPNIHDSVVMSLDIPDTMINLAPTRMPQPIKRLPRR